MPDELIIGCRSCGSVNQEATDLLARKDQALRDAERELRAKRAQISALKNKREADSELDPLAGDAKEIFDYWRSELAPRAREFTGDRLRAVLARLHAGHQVNDIKRAIDGIGLKPFVTDNGRDVTGTPAQREVDLELICRSERHLTRFQSYAEDRKADDPARTGLIPESRMLALQSKIEKPLVLRRLNEIKGWTPGAVQALGLGLDSERIVFFVRDAEGVLTGFHRYQPNKAKLNGHPKMLATGSRELFPGPETLESNTCWLVEGEPDAVALRSMNLPGVSVPGVATWKEGWAERFEKFDKVYVCFDCDEEGREAAAIRVGQLGKVTHAVPVDLDPARQDHYDLGDFLMEHGEAASSKLISLATASTGSVQPFQARLEDGEAPYSRIVESLRAHDFNVTERGTTAASSQCPNHEDRHPSLSLSEGDDGRVLLHCHAGCSPEEVVQALGLELRDLFARKAS